MRISSLPSNMSDMNERCGVAAVAGDASDGTLGASSSLVSESEREASRRAADGGGGGLLKSLATEWSVRSMKLRNSCASCWRVPFRPCVSAEQVVCSEPNLEALVNRAHLLKEVAQLRRQRWRTKVRVHALKERIE